MTFKDMEERRKFLETFGDIRVMFNENSMVYNVFLRSRHIDQNVAIGVGKTIREATDNLYETFHNTLWQMCKIEEKVEDYREALNAVGD